MDYVVRNTITGLFWSNEWGWGTLEGCQHFAHTNYNLPMEGEWVAAIHAVEVVEEW
jgi:hypothetical protein